MYRYQLNSTYTRSVGITPSITKPSLSVVFASPCSINRTQILLQHSRNHILATTNKGDLGPEQTRKPRFLCLHGFRTSAQIMKTQIGKWPDSVLDKLDLVFVDAPFPAQGKSDVEGIFDPPYYEWFQFNKVIPGYRNVDKCLAYIEEHMLELGPFDGLVGFSQGAVLSAAMPGFQAKGLALTKVPKIKCVIIIAGGKFRTQTFHDKGYSELIDCPSLHFIGKRDSLRSCGEKLLESFVDPFVINHPKGHTVPMLDEKSLEIMNSYIDKIQKAVSSAGEISAAGEGKGAFY